MTLNYKPDPDVVLEIAEAYPKEDEDIDSIGEFVLQVQSKYIYPEISRPFFDEVYRQRFFIAMLPQEDYLKIQAKIAVTGSQLVQLVAIATQKVLNACDDLLDEEEPPPVEEPVLPFPNHLRKSSFCGSFTMSCRISVKFILF